MVKFDPILTNCLLCESKGIILYHCDSNGIEIFRCVNCGIQFMNPQYSDEYLSDYYSEYKKLNLNETRL